MTPIRLEKVCKSFGEAIALRDIDLEIRAGEMFFLLGPSGCGKTTLLRIVAGLEMPDSGRVRFGEQDVTGLEASAREAVMVFQSYALWPHMTVEANVGFGLGVRKVPHGKARQMVRSALEQVHMAHLGGRRPGQLSGGQQQRVALARALVVRPRVLLLDEPLSNLDAALRTEMRDEIRSLCTSAGLTALYVTHDQHEAMAIADRIALVRDGRIEQTGTPLELYSRPSSAFAARFMGPTNLFECKVKGPGQGTGRPIEIETPLGILMADGSPDSPAPAQGTAMQVSIRPEAFRMRTAGNVAGPDEIEARVVASVFMGDRTSYEVSAGAATKIEVTVPGVGLPGACAGHEVLLSVDPRDVVIVACG